MFGFLKPKAPRSGPRAAPAATGAKARLFELDGETMGTRYHVAVATDVPVDEAALGAGVHDAVDAVDRQMSTWKPDSALSRFNRSAPGGWFDVPQALADVVHVGLTMSRDTDGAFDVTVGAAVNLWGFGPEGDHGVPCDDEVAAAIRGFDKLEARLDPPALRKSANVYVDLSAIAKGFGVDQIARYLEAQGIANYLVTLDGEVRMRGRKPGPNAPWVIAVEAPVAGVREAWDILMPSDCAIATSGDYRHFVEHNGRIYAHTIDGRTGRPVDNAIGSVTVCHADCMMADAWATALMVLGPDQGVAMAEARQLPALFLIRTAHGIEDIMTGDFASVIG